MLQPITAELSDVPAEVVHDVAWKQPKTCGLDASLAVHQLPTFPLVSWQCLGFHKISDVGILYYIYRNVPCRLLGYGYIRCCEAKNSNIAFSGPMKIVSFLCCTSHLETGGLPQCALADFLMRSPLLGRIWYKACAQSFISTCRR